MESAPEDHESKTNALDESDAFEAAAKTEVDSHRPTSPIDLDEAQAELAEEDIDDRDEALNELFAPAPDQNPEEHCIEHHRSLEEERDIGHRRSTSRQHDNVVLQTAFSKSTILHQAFTHSWLILFSILGTLARLGVEWLTYYRNAPVTTNVLWSNFGGSLILGYLQEDRALFAEKGNRHLISNSRSNSNGEETPGEPRADMLAKEAARKRSVPLFVGLAVGFCGSFTSYSSFMRDLYLGLSNELIGKAVEAGHRSPGWSVASVLGIAIVEISVSISALVFGAHLAIALLPLLSRIPNMNTAAFRDWLGVILGFGCWFSAIGLAIWPPHAIQHREILFSIVFAPLGTILRYWSSVILNRKLSSFPVGTFFANMLGTAVLAMAYDLQHTRLGGGARSGRLIGCQVLEGVMEGFCGCLTTVSTWVAELKSLRNHHAYRYGAVSVGTGFSLMILIVGSLHWTLGTSAAVCKI